MKKLVSLSPIIDVEEEIKSEFKQAINKQNKALQNYETSIIRYIKTRASHIPHLSDIDIELKLNYDLKENELEEAYETRKERYKGRYNTHSLRFRVLALGPRYMTDISNENSQNTLTDATENKDWKLINLCFDLYPYAFRNTDRCGKTILSRMMTQMIESHEKEITEEQKALFIRIAATDPSILLIRDRSRDVCPFFEFHKLPPRLGKELFLRLCESPLLSKENQMIFFNCFKEVSYHKGETILDKILIENQGFDLLEVILKTIPEEYLPFDNITYEGKSTYSLSQHFPILREKCKVIEEKSVKPSYQLSKPVKNALDNLSETSNMPLPERLKALLIKLDLESLLPPIMLAQKEAQTLYEEEESLRKLVSYSTTEQLNIKIKRLTLQFKTSIWERVGVNVQDTFSSIESKHPFLFRLLEAGPDGILKRTGNLRNMVTELIDNKEWDKTFLLYLLFPQTFFYRDEQGSTPLGHIIETLLQEAEHNTLDVPMHNYESQELLSTELNPKAIQLLGYITRSKPQLLGFSEGKERFVPPIFFLAKNEKMFQEVFTKMNTTLYYLEGRLNELSVEQQTENASFQVHHLIEVKEQKEELKEAYQEALSQCNKISPYKKQSPLHIAIRHGCWKIAYALLRQTSKDIIFNVNRPLEGGDSIYTSTASSETFNLGFLRSLLTLSNRKKYTQGITQSDISNALLTKNQAGQSSLSLLRTRYTQATSHSERNIFAHAYNDALTLIIKVLQSKLSLLKEHHSESNSTNEKEKLKKAQNETIEKLNTYKKHYLPIEKEPINSEEIHVEGTPRERSSSLAFSDTEEVFEFEKDPIDTLENDTSNYDSKDTVAIFTTSTDEINSGEYNNTHDKNVTPWFLNDYLLVGIQLGVGYLMLRFTIKSLNQVLKK